MNHTNLQFLPRYLGRHWSGELSLQISFWVNSVLLGVCAIALIVLIAPELARPSSPGQILMLWMLTSVSAFTLFFWQLCGVIRSARRVASGRGAVEVGGSDGSTCTGRGEVVGGTGEDLDAGTIHSDHAPARGEAGLTRVAGASEIADELSAATTTGTFWRGATVLAMGVFFVVELAVLVLACLPGLILGLIGFLGGDAEHSAAMKASSDGYEIEISGAIGLDLAQEFEQFLNKWPDAKTVHVNLNEGGSMTGAVKLRNLIHKRGLNTYVSSQCVSACALVFMGGRERLLRRYALIGFHRFSLYTIDIDIVEGVNTSKLKAEFRK
ncbi:MAG: hypothetical protein K8963_11535, partial [Proteobacteria bacterium]|nr:hypothetical protein [Pseudomonadota bacterium]